MYLLHLHHFALANCKARLFSIHVLNLDYPKHLFCPFRSFEHQLPDCWRHILILDYYASFTLRYDEALLVEFNAILMAKSTAALDHPVWSYAKTYRYRSSRHKAAFWSVNRWTVRAKSSALIEFSAVRRFRQQKNATYSFGTWIQFLVLLVSCLGAVTGDRTRANC